MVKKNKIESKLIYIFGKFSIIGAVVLGICMMVEVVKTNGNPTIFNLLLSLWVILILCTIIFNSNEFFNGFESWDNK